eukprot:146437-Rhodomonas_salina.2
MPHACVPCAMLHADNNEKEQRKKKKKKKEEEKLTRAGTRGQLSDERMVLKHFEGWPEAKLILLAEHTPLTCCRIPFTILSAAHSPPRSQVVARDEELKKLQ